MIITISGLPGAGKSTVGRLVAEHFKLKHYSVGDLMRQLAKEKKMSLPAVLFLPKLTTSGL